MIMSINIPFCPLCRHPRPLTPEEADLNRMKRVEVTDPVALREVGIMHHEPHNFNYSARDHLGEYSVGRLVETGRRSQLP